MNDLDKAARYAAKLEPVGLQRGGHTSRHCKREHRPGVSSRGFR